MEGSRIDEARICQRSRRRRRGLRRPCRSSLWWSLLSCFCVCVWQDRVPQFLIAVSCTISLFLHTDSVFLFEKNHKNGIRRNGALAKKSTIGTFPPHHYPSCMRAPFHTNPQHESETTTPADIAVRDFLYNLRTGCDFTSQLFADQSTTRGDNDEILPDPYMPQQQEV